MSDVINLKNCPFCCGKAQIVEGFRGSYESRHRIAFMQCDNCGAQGEKFSGIDCREKAFEAWNHRIHNEWISVKDRLPTSGNYLCYVKKIHKKTGSQINYECVYYYCDIKNRFKVDFDGEEVTHWMPLPETPK